MPIVQFMVTLITGPAVEPGVRTAVVPSAEAATVAPLGSVGGPHTGGEAKVGAFMTLPFTSVMTMT